MTRSLGCLDAIIDGQDFLRFRSFADDNNYMQVFLSGEEFSETDIIVAFPLLGLPSQIFKRCTYIHKQNCSFDTLN